MVSAEAEAPCDDSSQRSDSRHVYLHSADYVTPPLLLLGNVVYRVSFVGPLVVEGVLPLVDVSEKNIQWVFFSLPSGHRWQ